MLSLEHNPIVAIFGVLFSFLYANFYWFVPLVVFIVFLVVKSMKGKVITILLNVAWGIFLFILSEQVDGVGFADVIFGAIGFLTLLLAFLQGIITFIVFLYRKKKIKTNKNIEE